MHSDPSVYARQLTSADLAGDVPEPITAPAINWGIIGPGNIAASFADGVSARTRGRVVAVGSRDLARAQQFAADHALEARAYGDYQSLVSDDAIDVIYVATPHSFHLEHALLAIEAGKHVLVEKPIGVTYAEAATIFEAAARAGVFCMEAMWTRFLPQVAALRAAIARGEIGAVRTMMIDFDVPFPYDPGHRLYAPELAGGALLDLGIYPIAFAHDLMGVPDEFIVRGSLAATGVDDHVAMLMRWFRDDAAAGLQVDPTTGDADEVHALLHTSTRAAGPHAATIIGTEGRIVIPREFFMPVDFTLYHNDGSSWEFVSPVGEGKAYEAAEVARLITSGQLTSPRHSPSSALEVMTLLDEARRQVTI